jgi:hypothetical protein
MFFLLFGDFFMNINLWLVYPDQDSDPAIFVIVFEDANKNLYFFKFFCLIYIRKIFISF